MADLTVRDAQGSIIEEIEVSDRLIIRFANALGAAIHRASTGGGESPKDEASVLAEGIALGLSGPEEPGR